MTLAKITAIVGEGNVGMLTFLTTRYPDLFQSKKVPWYVANDDDSPR